MSRGDGFPIADVDVGILDDPKVRALVRSTTDEGLVARCVTAYLAVVTASWGDGERLPLIDAAPMWLTGLEDLAMRLEAAGLIDAGGRIPQEVWDRWYGPAWQRREDRRANGAKGGRAGGKGRPKPGLGNAQATPNPSVPSVPSVPIRSLPTNGRAAREMNGKAIEVDRA